MGWYITCVYQNCTSCVWNRVSTSSQVLFAGYKHLIAIFLIMTAIPGQIKSPVLQEIFCCLIVPLSLSLHSLAVPFL